MLPTIKAIAEADLLLLVHGEVTDPNVDMFDREKEFIGTVLVRNEPRSFRSVQYLVSLFKKTTGHSRCVDGLFVGRLRGSNWIGSV